MESTPFDYDDIVMTILLYLDLKEIKKLCQTQSRINIICADEHFWKLKLNHDFDSTFLDYKNRHKTWKETYEYVYLLHLDFNQLQYKHLNEQFWKDKYNLDFIFGQCIKTALLDLSWKKLYQFAKNVGTEFPILSYPFTDADLNRLYEGLVMPPKKSPHAEDFVDEIGELLESDNWGLVMIKNNKKIPLYNSILLMRSTTKSKTFMKPMYARFLWMIHHY